MIEVILLGIAQDAGVPQAGCACARCKAARADATLRRFAVSLGLVDHAGRRVWMIDATPDFREQVAFLEGRCPGYALAGLLLTHAHIGHYTGLIHLGLEGWNTHKLPLLASPRMIYFLSHNQPWAGLIERQNIHPQPIPPGKPFALSAELRLTPHKVPHRGEGSDTFAFEIQGPERRVFYCPDIDSWDAWAVDLRALIETMDVALLDATFYSGDELPGRDLTSIPHPLATDTAARLAGVGAEVVLIHLNHSNPLHEEGPAQRAMLAAGLVPGKRGMRWTL